MAGRLPSVTGWDWPEALFLTNFGISLTVKWHERLLAGYHATAGLSVVLCIFVSPPLPLLFLTVHRVMVAQKQDGGSQTGHRWLPV